MVLADVYEAQQDWKKLLFAAEQGMAAAEDFELERERLLEHRARANLELMNYANLMTDLNDFSETPGSIKRAAALRALMMLRTDKYEEAFKLAELHYTKTRLPTIRAIFVAVRFEAAQKLKRPSEGGELTTKVLSLLRHAHYYDWVDRLVEKYIIKQA